MLDTFDGIASAIGQVKLIAYDPEKPHLDEYVRAVVVLNLETSVRDTKSSICPTEEAQ
ncbi:unnamed protein product [Arabis nemorensis]|uniref:Uncharacterized protein n=1 Tax=Arabis nemorensis TaxID=586526 RepID=A0A565CCA3_9BRAS|nr:unnamed protein product [Arabis nemorensis]